MLNEFVLDQYQQHQHMLNQVNEHVLPQNLVIVSVDVDYVMFVVI
jgi:hypothetical protein